VVALLASAQVRCSLSDFDIISVSRGYCTIAGVMAGFAFAALIAILTTFAGRSARQANQFGAASQVLAIAFMGLLLSAVSYAVLTGENANGPRTAAEEIFAGIAFSASAVLLIYAIVLTFEAASGLPASHRALGPTSLERAGERMREFGGVVFAPLAMAYIFLGSSDYTTTRYPQHTPAWINWFGIGLIVLQLLIAGTLLWQRKNHPDRVRAANDAFPYFALAAIVFGAIAVATSQAVFKTCDVAPLPLVLGLLVVVFVTMTAASWSFLAGPSMTRRP
jgi:hypothetical protein